MSEVDESLLGHRSDLAAARWRYEGAARHHTHKGWRCTLALAVTLLFTLSALFTVFLRWNSALKTAETTKTDPLNLAAVREPERDLGFLLHPEDHVSREPGVRRFVWNITKATIAPDGVQKEVFLINSLSHCIQTSDLEGEPDEDRSISRSHDRGSTRRHPRDRGLQSS
jgi:hypothetical protein